MWIAYDEADLFVITTNGTIKRNGALVMGRGIARQARDKFLGLDLVLGKRIAGCCDNSSTALRADKGGYGLLVSPRWPEAKLGVFQVKRRFNDTADLELVQFSVTKLRAWCVTHPGAIVHMDFPGIGNGRLCREDVLPIVMQLPDQVSIWEYPLKI
jgi:hypothetical protein